MNCQNMRIRRVLTSFYRGKCIEVYRRDATYRNLYYFSVDGDILHDGKYLTQDAAYTAAIQSIDSARIYEE